MLLHVSFQQDAPDSWTIILGNHKGGTEPTDGHAIMWLKCAKLPGYKCRCMECGNSITNTNRCDLAKVVKQAKVQHPLNSQFNIDIIEKYFYALFSSVLHYYCSYYGMHCTAILGAIINMLTTIISYMHLRYAV